MALRPPDASYSAPSSAWVLRAWAVAAFASFDAACSLAVDASRPQCESDRDCMTGASALPAGVCIEGLCDTRDEWRCPPAESAALAGAEVVEVALPVIDLLARDPGASIEASLCRKLDVSCEAPTQTMTMDASGEVLLRLEPSFDGYLSVRGDALVPTLYFLSPPLEPGERLPALALMSPALMEALALEMQVTLLPDRGLGLFSVQDCAGAFAPGVSFEASPSDPSITPFYDVDGLPTPSASATGRTGSGGFVNAPAGTLTVAARLTSGAPPVASASVLIRPGFVSYGRLLPSGALPDPSSGAR